jgi:RNA polymerase sigma-70 factor, ECF subfamily
MLTETEPTTPTESAWNEEVIIKQSQTDSEAFRPLYEKYYKRLFLFLLHRTGERESAADLCQQVFLKALKGLSKFQFRGLPFSAWLYRIAINECNDFFKKTKRERLVTLDDVGLNHLFEEMTAENTIEELHRKLPSILQQLQEDELQLIELRFFEGRQFKEIGDILQITENYAKVKTYRVLDRMKKLFLGKQ